MECVVCSSTGVKVCSQCKLMSYCSETCQRRDWTKKHRTLCKVAPKKHNGRYAVPKPYQKALRSIYAECINSEPNDNPTRGTIRCQNKTYFIHLALVKHRCLPLYNLLVENTYEEHEFNLETMNIIMRYIYTDDVIVPSTGASNCAEFITNLRKAAVKFKLPVLLTFCNNITKAVDSSAWRIYAACAADALDVTMKENMENLAKDSTHADVEFILADASVFQHGFMLKFRSGYFKAMLSSHWSESTPIDVSDLSTESFHSLMEHVYVGRTNVSETNAIDLLIASKRLLFEDFDKPLEYIKENISIDNSMQVLDVAHKFDLDELVNSTMAFINTILHHRRDVVTLEVVTKLRAGYKDLEEEMQKRFSAYSSRVVQDMLRAETDKIAYDSLLDSSVFRSTLERGQSIAPSSFNFRF